MGRLRAGTNGCVLIKLMGSRWQWWVIGGAIIAIERAERRGVPSEHAGTYLFVTVFYYRTLP
ncbi:hypothetical protein X777_08995 [Ooceraea biroi]|uniref:Uncharacterized protein n=1 Tax=Ooceraea biroi TaxID=2015173 RepID=A0A026W8E1_OOCBI|nr:hypothetical protein X777_08995 [Ooceraea biroi]